MPPSSRSVYPIPHWARAFNQCQSSSSVLGVNVAEPWLLVRGRAQPPIRPEPPGALGRNRGWATQREKGLEPI